MKFIRTIREKQQTAREENLAKEAEKVITLSDFANTLYIAYNSVPYIQIDDNATVILYNKNRDTKFNIPIETLNKFWVPITEDEYKDTNFGLQDTIKKGHNNVNHPSHYTWLKEKAGIEVIDITRWLPADISNAVKYLLRQGHKHEEGMSNNQKAIEDCKKAIWYINDYINNVLKNETIYNDGESFRKKEKSDYFKKLADKKYK